MIDEVMADWPTDQPEMKSICRRLAEAASELAERELELVSRPGVSYSIRAVPDVPSQRPVWVMMDVIPGPSEPWWLSVCFYADTITDPDERGDLIPEGLLGQDGYCFDIDEPDEEMFEYMLARLKEAHGAS